MARIRVTDEEVNKTKVEKLPKGFWAALKEGKDKAMKWIKDNRQLLAEAGLAGIATGAIIHAAGEVYLNKRFGKSERTGYPAKKMRDLKREEISEEVG